MILGSDLGFFFFYATRSNKNLLVICLVETGERYVNVDQFALNLTGSLVNCHIGCLFGLFFPLFLNFVFPLGLIFRGICLFLFFSRIDRVDWLGSQLVGKVLMEEGYVPN